MPLFSKQKIFCNACGKECFSVPHAMMGRDFKVCSIGCIREMQWRDTLSIMGTEYYPDPRPKEDE